ACFAPWPALPVWPTTPPGAPFGCGIMHQEPAQFPQYVSPSASFAGAAGWLPPALSANVLVLNRFYQAIRVVNVRRAFSLLCRELAEVVHIETDARAQRQWQNL